MSVLVTPLNAQGGTTGCSCECCKSGVSKILLGEKCKIRNLVIFNEGLPDAGCINQFVLDTTQPNPFFIELVGKKGSMEAVDKYEKKGCEKTGEAEIKLSVNCEEAWAKFYNQELTEACTLVAIIINCYEGKHKVYGVEVLKPYTDNQVSYLEPTSSFEGTTGTDGDDKTERLHTLTIKFSQPCPVYITQFGVDTLPVVTA